MIQAAKKTAILLLLSLVSLAACDPPAPDRGFIVYYNASGKDLEYVNTTKSWGNNRGQKFPKGTGSYVDMIRPGNQSITFKDGSGKTIDKKVEVKAGFGTLVASNWNDKLRWAVFDLTHLYDPKNKGKKVAPKLKHIGEGNPFSFQGRHGDIWIGPGEKMPESIASYRSVSQVVVVTKEQANKLKAEAAKKNATKTK